MKKCGSETACARETAPTTNEWRGKISRLNGRQFHAISRITLQNVRPDGCSNNFDPKGRQKCSTSKTPLQCLYSIVLLHLSQALLATHFPQPSLHVLKNAQAQGYHTQMSSFLHLESEIISSCHLTSIILSRLRPRISIPHGDIIARILLQRVGLRL